MSICLTAPQQRADRDETDTTGVGREFLYRLHDALASVLDLAVSQVCLTARPLSRSSAPSPFDFLVRYQTWNLSFQRPWYKPLALPSRLVRGSIDLIICDLTILDALNPTILHCDCCEAVHDATHAHKPSHNGAATAADILPP